MSRSSVETTLPGQLIDTKPQQNVILNLVDYDGCFGRRASQDNLFDQNRWLVQNNQLLLTHLKKQIDSTSPDRIIFGLGTNRQDYATDLYNSNRNNNGSCISSLLVLQDYFKEMHAGVFFDPFMMADIYHSDTIKSVISSGKSYTNIYINSPENTHAKASFDENKISLIYAHAHRVALLNPNATTIRINFFDDRPAILISLIHFFSDHPDLLPNNVQLYSYCYNGHQLQTVEKILSNKFIQGMGPVDKNYDWTIRLMAAIARETEGNTTGPAHTRSPSYFLDDPSSLLVDHPIQINLLNYFNDQVKKENLLTARNTIQTWESKISRDGYKTAYQFKKLYETSALMLASREILFDGFKARSFDEDETDENDFAPGNETDENNFAPGTPKENYLCPLYSLRDNLPGAIDDEDTLEQCTRLRSPLHSPVNDNTENHSIRRENAFGSLAEMEAVENDNTAAINRTADSVSNDCAITDRIPATSQNQQAFIPAPTSSSRPGAPADSVPNDRAITDPSPPASQNKHAFIPAPTSSSRPGAPTEATAAAAGDALSTINARDVGMPELPPSTERIMPNKTWWRCC